MIRGLELVRLMEFWIELACEGLVYQFSRLTQGSAISGGMSALLNECFAL